MAETPKTGYLKLADVAKVALFEMEETGTAKVQRAVHWACDCVKQLNMQGTIANIKTVAIKVSDMKTINLPADYVEFTKLGILVSGPHGPRLITFALKANLPLSNGLVDDCGNPVALSGLDLTTCEDTVGGYYFENYNKGRIFGYGGGRNLVGYYRYNQENDWIEFESDMAFEYVYMEYKTNGLSATGTSYVHPNAEFTIKAYIKYRLTKTNEKGAYEKEYWNQRRLLRSSRLRFTAKEYIQSTRKHYGMAVKNI